MTPEQVALRDAFLAECWRPVPEVPKEWRDAKRKSDRVMQRRMEEAQVVALSTDRPQESTGCAQTCAQNGSEKGYETAAEVPDSMGNSTCRPNGSTPGLAGPTASASRGLAS